MNGTEGRASDRPVGRPPMEMPDMIPDTPTNVARKVLTTKPKKGWAVAIPEAQEPNHLQEVK